MYGILIPVQESSFGRIHLRKEIVCGLSILRAEVPMKGFRGSGREERKFLRAANLLYKRGVRELLNPPDFYGWDFLRQTCLHPVNVGEVCCAAAVPLTLQVLRMRGWEPGRATVALVGERVGKYLVRAAEGLASHVKSVVIDAPGEGEKLTERLHREYGLPVLQSGAVRPSLTVAFDPVWRGKGAALLLYGIKPCLLGARLYAEGVEQSEDYPTLSLLAALWSKGLISDKVLRAAANCTMPDEGPR